MKLLPPDASDDDVLDAAREWAELLASGRYGDAVDFLYEPRPERPGAWTAQLLETVITHYGSIEPRSDGKTFRVTHLDRAFGGPTPRHEVTRWGTGEGRPEQMGDVWFDLPLNGEWSDLTATFDLVSVVGGLALVLNDVHVM